ncbi:pentatricopeptide repeat-containing protein 2, mitochondrial isoform X6 [Onychomys torridus]|uniref:pentatricopeptide repeat-containing protein 2, mitochondrial isoform X6 n=1 Tax=Onychomys torridus TaxID=38674 RepID=UPI00167F4962|nr:pentatricopeptide repeat-containing protein 2, mitochondrial isoform X6 [Onychomys torridus]
MYHAENRNFTVGEYKFGPVFMRLCYELDLENSAVELIKDKHLRGFFLDSTSFNILMDMLFTKGKYESALEVLIEMKNQDVKFSKDTYILAFAICYKLNSPESFKICTTLREEALIKGDVVSRRACCFAVALALNQNQVEKATSIFSQIMNPESITCANLNGKPVSPHERGVHRPTLNLSAEQAVLPEHEADCLQFSQEPVSAGPSEGKTEGQPHPHSQV